MIKQSSDPEVCVNNSDKAKHCTKAEYGILDVCSAPTTSVEKKTTEEKQASTSKASKTDSEEV